MDTCKDELPRYSPVDELAHLRRRHRRGPPRLVKLLVLAGIAYFVFAHWTGSSAARHGHHRAVQLLSADRLHADYAVCSKLRSVPHDPSGPRDRSARYLDGHNPVLIRNATVWTGEPAPGTTAEEARRGVGYSWIQADVLLEYGLIKEVRAGIPDSELPKHVDIYEAHGRLLTTGIVDMHSHTGVDPQPSLPGGEDTNEISKDITPYVRSIDGLDPLDHQLQVIKSGGVTTSLILPGSGNNMGGEAFVIKHAVGRPDGRAELSIADMLADPDKTWRYMKMACGENPKRIYGKVGTAPGPFSRLGEAWFFRHAFEQATAMVNSQNDWCAAADQLGAENMQTYLPQELEWESLGALLRGQVLLNTHCYTVADLESFVGHTNEFKFAVRAFHHAHQTYLVPEVLKRAYGGRPPAAALFADNMYYKVEAYVASEKAGNILWENGITPIYVSDNPVLNAQHVVFEAAKAYRNGLPYHVALAGVTSASAELLGLGERIGKVKPGFDADIVVWDSDPLSIGAAPVQVWIDGTPQYEHPVELKKASAAPLKPNVDRDDISEEPVTMQDVVFTGVSRILLGEPLQSFSDSTGSTVVIQDGAIACAGHCRERIAQAEQDGVPVIALKDGHISPPFTAFGTSLGLVEISGEKETQDGRNGDDSFSRAIDGLALDNKQLKAAYAHGVTKAISAPLFADGGFKGLSAGFSTGALHTQQDGAVWQDEVALHYTLTKTSKTPSLSSSVGALRSALLRAASANATDLHTPEEKSLAKVAAGQLALVISANSADLIAAVLRLKADVEALENTASQLRIVVLGAAESHLVARELAAARVGVVLAPALPYASSWDQRRSLTGAPLTNGTAIDALHAAGVTFALGMSHEDQPRNLNLVAGIAYANGGGKISEADALDLVSANVYEMLGIEDPTAGSVTDFVVFEGHPLEIDGRVKAVADRGLISVF